MKKLVSIFCVILSCLSVTSQVDMEEQEFLKNGKIKITHVNSADNYSEPEFTAYKKISELRKVIKVKDEVTSLEIYCEKSGTLKYSREFVARGMKNDDGTLRDVFGYYSKRADMWAVPYNGSIYIINASIRKIETSKELAVRYVIGENIADRVDLFNYYKAIYAKYEGKTFTKEEPETKEELLATTLSPEEKLNTFSIERNEIASIKVISKFTKYVNDRQRSVIIGVEAVFENGIVSKTKEFKGGGINSEYIFEVEGAFGSDIYQDVTLGGWYRYNVSTRRSLGSDDFIKVKVKRKSNNELLVEGKINIPYDIQLYFDFTGRKGYRNGDGQNGADVELDIEQIKHSETQEPLLLYTIRYDFGTYDDDGNPKKGTYQVKMSPKAQLRIHYSGGRGGDGYSSGGEGGKKGSLKLNVSSNVEEYNLEQWGYDGTPGYGDYQSTADNTSSSGSDNASDEITIVNETGKSVCVAHSGGSTSINNGSSEEFSCRDLYYGIMDGAHCTGKFGSKIADEENNCGGTITLE